MAEFEVTYKDGEKIVKYPNGKEDHFTENELKQVKNDVELGKTIADEEIANIDSDITKIKQSALMP